ncbi:MAG TPA: hypothetical protein VFF70_14290 [Anaerolineae bacterium]|jgi:hypothetical protein|nr:hypothetical protein [Anaerolineae bacterium]
MTTNQSPKTTPSKKQTVSKFDQMFDEWRSGKQVGWSDLLAAWVEAPPAPRSPDLVIKVIRSMGAK